MKVYVVTSGCYSDYQIEEIFLDKEKAYNYAKYNNTYWSDLRVEEYETSDEHYNIVSSGYYNVVGEFTISKQNKTYGFRVYEPILQDSLKNNIEITKYNLSWDDDLEEWNIRVTRSYSESKIKATNMDAKELIKNTFNKVLQDLGATIAYYKSQGYSIEDVNNLLGEVKDD